MEKNIDERRKYIRVKSNFNIKIDIDAKKIRHFFSNVVKSVDISGSGVLFRYNKLVELGTIIKITFLMPNSFDFFEGKAKVVRTEINPDNKTYDIGIIFIDLNEDDKGTLNYYVTREEGF